MKRIATGLAFLALSVAPALAGGWDEDDYYYSRHWRDYRAYYSAPTYRVPAYEVYIPYGSYFVDEPDSYGPDCEIERKWRHGRYKERIECDD
ncbi:MAG: hypothetical protein J0H65_17810 [Rhizobiales bacterium]|nr:hypothetical protein [Hyphomicrobiales bacterium]